MKRPSRFQKLGLGRSVSLAWMDMALALTLSGTAAGECRDQMMAAISGERTATGDRGTESARKAVRFTACWYSPIGELALFRDQLLSKAKSLPQERWVALHWAVLMANYPFLLNTAVVFGRLFSLQEKVEKGQIESRLRDIYGAQPFIERNMRYAIAILFGFGLISATGKPGVYTTEERPKATDAETTALLWKAMLHGTEGGKLPYTALRNSPAYFPFSMTNIGLEQFLASFPDVKCDHYLGSDELVSIVRQSSLDMK